MRKRQWKKVLSLVLALAMVFSMNTSVFAAEVQAPEAAPAVETEAPAPAETPAAEAPAAEEPAPAEAPAAETPAAETPTAETPAAETPAAEAPAAEEPAKEEAAEAAPAEEAPKAEEAAAEVSEAEVKEEAAEAAPAVEVEEAAGEAIDWQTETSGFKVSLLASAGGTASTNRAQVAKKDPSSASADYIISVNGTLTGTEQIVVEAKDGQAPSINKIYLSADSAASINSLRSLALSGNVFAYNGRSIYRNDTEEVAGTCKITLYKDYVYSKADGEIVKLYSDSTTITDLDAQWIYKDSPVSMTVSNDKWSASFNETVTEVYNDSLSNAPLYKGSASKNDVKLKNIGDSGISEADVFVRRANGYLASVDIVNGSAIHVKGVSVDAAVDSATSKVVSVNVTAGTDYIVYDKAEWGEEEKDLIDFAPETGWKKIEGGEISVNFAGPNQTKYVLIRNKANATLTRYDYLELISRAEVPTTGWVSQDGIWSARKTNGGSIPLEVWVNGTNPSKLLISGNVTKDVDIALEAKSESADTIDQIIISGDEVGKVTFVPSTNKIGTKFNDPTVYSQSGNQLDYVKTSDTATGIIPLVVEKDVISVNAAGPNVIPKGAEVFAAVDVAKSPAGYAKVSYNDVTLTLSDNASAVYVYGNEYKGMLETSQEFKKDTAGDVFDYVADQARVFFEVPESAYLKTKYAAYSFEGATFAEPAPLTIDKYHYNYFTPSDFVANTEYAVSSESGNSAEFYKGLTYYIKNKSGSFKVTSTNGVKDDLEQGQTYYVYGFKKGNGTSTFSGYGEVGNVTLGISANFAIEANADGHGFLVNNEINGTMVSWDAVPGQNVKIGGVDYQVTRGLIEDYAKAFDGKYSVSSNEKFSPAGTLDRGSESSKFALNTKGEWFISINGINAKENYAKDDIAEHNTINITLKNGTFPVGDKDSEIKVTLPDYYYGLDEVTFLDKAEAKLDGSPMKAYNLVAQYGESVSSDGKTIVKTISFDKVQTLLAGSTFAARFYLGEVGQAPSTNAVTVSVNKMPLNISAERNFFSVQGADLAKADAISNEEIIIKDLYGTAYEARVKEESEYSKYIKGDVKPDFSTVEYKAEGDMAKIKGRQDYGLNVTLADALSKNAANYEITKTNAEKFGYYVAPVYEVAFKGSALKAVKYEGKELQKKELKSGGAAFVASVSSAAAKKFPPADKYARQTDVSDVYDVTAEVVLPKTSDNASANEIVLNGSSTFVSWMRDKKAVSGKDKISDNGVVYNANVKEGVIGFDPKNGLAVTIVNEDDITFTGLNHVSDYHEQFENPSANRPGTDAAKEKTRQTALKNSGDVDLQVWVGDTLLVENYDYVVKYKNNKNAYSLEGKTSADINKKAPQVTITFKNGYATYPTVTKYFSINPADIEDITTGCGVDSRIVKKAAANKTADKVFTKTDLVNVNTGAALKFNKTEAKSDVKFEVDGDIHTEGEVKVTVKGLNNYTGEKDVTVYIVDKVKWTTVNINKGKPDGTNEAIPFTNEDTLEPNQSTIEDEIKAAVAAKDSSATDLEEIVLYRAKGGYVLPGAKKVAFKTIAVVNGKATGFKGNYKYKIAPVTKAQLDEMKPDWTIPTDGVPFVKAGATVQVEASYGGSDCMKLFKVGFANNKKPGTATAKLTAAAGAYFDKDAKNALKADPFVKTFTINKAKLNENILIKSAYVAEGDGTDVKKIAKTGGIVITDEMGTILKANGDYTIDSFSNDTNKVKLKAKGNNFEGETEIDVTKVNPYLGTCTVAFDKGAPKKIKEADIEKLESGEMTNADFASAYKLVVKNGRNTLTQVNNSISGNNFNFVVTKAKVGGKCYIQAVGCDGGAFGGSDVLAKKQVNKTVE